MANSVVPDQTPHSVASDLGLHCLPRPVCPSTQGYYGIMKEFQTWPVFVRFLAYLYSSFILTREVIYNFHCSQNLVFVQFDFIPAEMKIILNGFDSVFSMMLWLS